MSMQINCTLCDFVAKQQLELNTHAFSKHNQCVTCGNTFGNASELISHKKSVHHKNRNTGYFILPDNLCIPIINESDSFHSSNHVFTNKLILKFRVF